MLHNRQLMYTGSKTRFVENAIFDAARIRYAQACGALMNIIESQVDGLERARKLVDQAFGIGEDGGDKVKNKNDAKSSNDENDWEDEDQRAMVRRD